MIYENRREKRLRFERCFAAFVLAIGIVGAILYAPVLLAINVARGRKRK